jgi:hypothetical protein
MCVQSSLVEGVDEVCGRQNLERDKINDLNLD